MLVARRCSRGRCARRSRCAAPSPTASAMLPVPASKRCGAPWNSVRSKVTSLDHVAAALPGRQAVEQILLAVEHADARRGEHLVPREHEEVGVELLHVDPHVRDRLRAVDAAPSRRRGAPSRPSAFAGVTVPSAFETCGNATSLVRALSSLPYSSSSTWPRSSTGATRSFAPLASASCCHGTMLAWCSRCVMTISSPAPMCLPPQLLRDEVDRLGGAAHEHDLVGRRRIEEARAPSRARPRRRRSSARRARAPRGGCWSSRARRNTSSRSMTAFGFCVVAALSSQTSGRPFTCSTRIGKSRRMALTSNGGCADWKLGRAAGSRRGVAPGRRSRQAPRGPMSFEEIEGRALVGVAATAAASRRAIDAEERP